METDEVQVGDIALHLLEAIERGETNVSLTSNRVASNGAVSNGTNMVGDSDNSADDLSGMDSSTATQTLTKPRFVPKVPTAVPAPSPVGTRPSKELKDDDGQNDGNDNNDETDEQGKNDTTEKAESATNDTNKPEPEKESEAKESKESATKDELGDEQKEELPVEKDESAETDEGVKDESAEISDKKESAKKETASKPDDLLLIRGMSPELIAPLTEKGITIFAQIAALTDEEVLQLEQDLEIPGRIQRWAWVLQARHLNED